MIVDFIVVLVFLNQITASEVFKKKVLSSMGVLKQQISI